jgi:hypothetical protein
MQLIQNLTIFVQKIPKNSVKIRLLKGHFKKYIFNLI